MEQLAAVAQRRADGESGFMVTFLAAPDVGGCGWRAEDVHPIASDVLVEPTADAVLALAYATIPSLAPTGEQAFIVLHDPAGTWAVFPSLVVGT